ncbi:hypothetical protein SLEP1_g38162 [Rubroshorea leprosula]|uniref:Uncharacterized protein n=1 Tax=Rubroshorea leprosula TaxID=152421 RepID=A0AAV5KX16_9ROSI|nr:hypothetical protein SLEP1_g38162 [Rubroshorea leprosula]
MAAGFASKCPPKPRCQGDQRHIDGGGKENHDDLD